NIEWPEGRAAVIPGQHAYIVVQARQQLGEPPHGACAAVDVEVAELQQCESVEAARQLRRRNAIVPDLDVLGIAHAPPMEAGQFEREPDQGMDRVPVLDVKEVEPLPEDLGLVIPLDSQPLPRVQASQPLLELVQDLIVHCRSPRNPTKSALPSML